MGQLMLLALTVTLLATGQVLQKLAARELESTEAGAHTLKAMFSSRYFWFAALTLALALSVWLVTLTLVPVSRAYPALSLSFVLTALLSQFLLEERVSSRHWFGIVLVVLGAVLLLGVK